MLFASVLLMLFKVIPPCMTLHSKKEQVGEVIAVTRSSDKLKGVQQCLPGTKAGINNEQEYKRLHMGMGV